MQRHVRFRSLDMQVVTAQYACMLISLIIDQTGLSTASFQTLAFKLPFCIVSKKTGQSMQIKVSVPPNCQIIMNACMVASRVMEPAASCTCLTAHACLTQQQQHYCHMLINSRSERCSAPLKSQDSRACKSNLQPWTIKIQRTWADRAAELVDRSGELLQPVNKHGDN